MWGTVYPQLKQLFLWRSLDMPCSHWHHTQVVVALPGGRRPLLRAPLASSPNPSVLLWSQGEFFSVNPYFQPQTPNANVSLRQRHTALRGACGELSSATISPLLLLKSLHNTGLNNLYYHISRPKSHLLMENQIVADHSLETDFYFSTAAGVSSPPVSRRSLAMWLQMWHCPCSGRAVAKHKPFSALQSFLCLLGNTDPWATGKLEAGREARLETTSYLNW